MGRENRTNITMTMAIFVIAFVVLLASANLIQAETSRWTASGLRGRSVSALVFDPQNLQVLYAATDRGIVRSANGGRTWKLIRSRRSPLPAMCHSLTMSPVNPKVLYALCPRASEGVVVSYDLYRSTTGGMRWTRRSGIPNVPVTNLALTADPLYPQQIYLLCGGRLFSSRNGGVKWTPLDKKFQGGFVGAFAIDPTNPLRMYAVIRPSEVLNSVPTKIFMSVDAGTHWTRFETDTPSVARIILPLSSSTFYAETYDGTGMMMSSDGGTSWKAGGLPQFTSLVVDPRDPRVLYAGTSDGVFWSDNGGESWTSINEGLSDRTVYTLTLDPVSRTTLHVGTNDGVARLRITGRRQAKVLATVESPEENQPVSGIAVLRGWAFSVQPGVQISQIQSSVGRGLTLTCCSIRRDVQKAFPQFPTKKTLYSGWGVGVPWGLHSPGKHVVRVRIQTSNGVVFYPKPHAVTVMKPGDSEFLDQFLVSTAKASIVGNELVLNDVVIRDAKTQRQQRIRASFRWFPGSQSFGLTHATTTSSVSPLRVSLPLRLFDTFSELGRLFFLPVPARASARMRAFIESPEEKQVVSGTGVIRGWTFSEWRNVFTRKARLRIDGVLQGEVPCCSQRSDIEAAFSHEVPAGTMLGAVEWSGVISYGKLEPGSHQLEVQLEDTLGEVLTLERMVTVVRVGGFSSLDQCDLSGATVRIEGDEVLLKKVRVREKASQKTKRVDIRLRWFGHSQALGIVASS